MADYDKIEGLLEQLTEELSQAVNELDELGPYEIAMLETLGSSISKRSRRKHGLSRKEVEAIKFGVINGMGIVEAISDEPDEESTRRAAQGFISGMFNAFLVYRDLDYDFDAWLDAMED